MVAQTRSEELALAAGKRYRRPLIAAIGSTVLAELLIFVIWGLLLYPGGDLGTMLMWTVGFCGVGMGAVVGSLLVLFVVDRLSGAAAILATSAIYTLVPGVACNLLCYQLDTNYFQYFGGGDTPWLFLGSGLLNSSLGGAAVGWGLFTKRGRQVLASLGL